MSSQDDGEMQSKEALRQKLLQQLKKKGAKDEDVLAILLVLTRTMDQTNHAHLRELYQALDPTFFNRLMFAQSADEDSELYISLAMSLLAAFSRLPDLASDQVFLSRVPGIVSMTTSHLDDPDDTVGGDIKNSGMEVLSAVANVEGGHRLLAGNTQLVPLLLDMLSSKADFGIADTMLKSLLMDTEAKATEKHGSALIGRLPALCQAVATRQDDGKFALVGFLDTMLATLGDRDEHMQQLRETQPLWSTHLYTALNDILSSRIKTSWRKDALSLLSTLQRVLGPDWLLAHGNGAILTLATRLCLVEIRMVLENGSVSAAVEQASSLGVSFSVVESAIGLAVTASEDKALAWATEFASKTRDALTDTMKGLMSFLKDVEAEYGTDLRQLTGLDSVVLGCVRLLSAWLAEDSEALREEVAETLPYLLALVGNGWPQVLYFLLPALCAISTDEQMRNVLVANNGHILLLSGLSNWLSQGTSSEPPVWSSSLEPTSAATTAINILLTISALEPVVLRKTAEFDDVARMLMGADLTDTTQAMYATALCLFILRNRGRPGHVSNDLLLSFYKNACGLLTATIELTDVAELWQLSAQVLSGMVANNPQLLAALLNSEVLPSAMRALDRGKVDADVYGPLEELLCAVAKCGDQAMAAALASGAPQQAGKLHMAHLEQILRN